MVGCSCIFNRKRYSCRLLVLKLINFLKLWAADNVSSWERCNEKEPEV